MTLFDEWPSPKDERKASIARGAALFGATRFDMTQVGGLNDELGTPANRGSCTTCHDTPNVGNHSVALPIDIGLTDASRRTCRCTPRATSPPVRRARPPTRAGRW